MEQIEIEQYSQSYKEDVITLIIAIQKNEFGVAIDLKDQPDLENIETFYQKATGNFWVAKINGTIAGTVALLDIGNFNCALRKMFVKKEYRGSAYGIGQLLLNIALTWAETKNTKRILLGTTEKFIAAQRFYEKNNFHAIKKELLPAEFPIMQVDVKFYEYFIK